MNATYRHSSAAPTGVQVLLLRAALWSGNDATAAIRTWKQQVDAEALDDGSEGLLPLLFWNLQRLGLSDALLPRLRSSHRRTWSRNQRILHRSVPIVQRLQQAGVPTMVLKGCPMAIHFYRDVGARPMSDLDVLVPQSSVPIAVDILRSEGWDIRPAEPRNLGPDDLLCRHGNDFVNPGGDTLDLHWFPLLHVLSGDATDTFWKHAQPISVLDVETTRPSPTDLLLQAVLHGLPWNVSPPIRWAADAFLLSQCPAVDWSRLWQQAERWEASEMLRDGLTWLRDELCAPVVLPLRTRRSLAERVEYATTLLAHEARPAWMVVLYRYRMYRRSELSRRFRPRWLGFPRFLMGLLDATPRQLLERAAGRMRRQDPVLG